MRKRTALLLTAAAMLTSTLLVGPATAGDGPRACDNWYFNTGSEYRLSHCASPYFVQDVVKAHARLHLYVKSGAYWVDPGGGADSLTINEWKIVTTQLYDRAPQSTDPPDADADFYSAGVGVSCGQSAYAVNRDESVRIDSGFAFYGPGAGTAEETVTSPTSQRPCG